jgi:hypothetical protein
MDIGNAVGRPPSEQVRERDSAPTDEIEVVARYHEHTWAIVCHVELFWSGSRRNIQSADQENGKKSASWLFSL